MASLKISAIYAASPLLASSATGNEILVLAKPSSTVNYGMILSQVAEFPSPLTSDTQVLINDGGKVSGFANLVFLKAGEGSLQCGIFHTHGANGDVYFTPNSINAFPASDWFWTNASNTNTRFAAASSYIFDNIILPMQHATSGGPAYVKGAIYFDTTLNKLRVGGATGWET